MGYYFKNNATRESTIAEIIQQTPTMRTLAHTTRSQTLWTVQEVTREGSPPLRFIGCYKLAADRGGYGYKPMEESMGPYLYDCPVSYLDMVPQPEGTIAAEWRAKVRAFHAATRAKRTVRASLEPGQTVQLKDGCKPPSVTIVTVRPLIGEYNGTRYKVSPRFLRDAE